MNKAAPPRVHPFWLPWLLLVGACQSEAAAPVPAASARAPDTALDYEPAPAVPAKPLAAPVGAGGAASEALPADATLLVATGPITPVRIQPDDSAPALGYLRPGARVQRAAEPVTGSGCGGVWYAVTPHGFVCGAQVTLDLDAPLLPAASPEPASSSSFHGVDLGAALALPLAFVRSSGASSWQLVRGRDEVRGAAAVPYRALVPLSGELRIKAGARHYQTLRDASLWLRAADIAVVAAPPELPREAEQGERWIDVSLAQQTLVLYRGRIPEYATLISSGKLDPSGGERTPLGTFRIVSKHVTATLDSDEGSSLPGGQRARTPAALGSADQAIALRLLAAERAGKRLSRADQARLANVKQGKQPEHGLDAPRGSGPNELEHVPWVQYFAPGYALRGAYWHDHFGQASTRGCIDLSPIDAFVLFAWTAPGVPRGWHGADAGETLGAGTILRVRE